MPTRKMAVPRGLRRPSISFKLTGVSLSPAKSRGIMSTPTGDTRTVPVLRHGRCRKLDADHRASSWTATAGSLEQDFACPLFPARRVSAAGHAGLPGSP